MSSALTFGVLPEWWDFPCLPEEKFQELLLPSSFCQQSLQFHDTNEISAQEMTLYVATAADTAPMDGGTGQVRRCFVVDLGQDSPARVISSVLVSELKNMNGLDVKTVDMRHLKHHNLQDSVYVSVLRLDAFDFSITRPQDYENI